MGLIKDYNEFSSKTNIETNQDVEILRETIKAIESGEEPRIDEGLLKTLVGGAAGFVIGPHVGKAICKALGVTNGILYDLLTSKIFNTLFAAYVTKKN